MRCLGGALLALTALRAPPSPMIPSPRLATPVTTTIVHGRFRTTTMLCAPPSPDHVDLIDEALRVTREESDEQRKELIETTVVSWGASERQRFSDELSDELSARAVSVQTAALAAYERGEDVTEASETLQCVRFPASGHHDGAGCEQERSRAAVFSDWIGSRWQDARGYDRAIENLHKKAGGGDGR
jgi:hypothetical protein